MLFPQGTRGAGPEGDRGGVAQLALTAGVPTSPIPHRGHRARDAQGQGASTGAGKNEVTRPARSSRAPARRRGQLTQRLHDAIED